MSGSHARLDITRINSSPENRYGSIHFVLGMCFFSRAFCIRCTLSEFLKAVRFCDVFCPYRCFLDALFSMNFYVIDLIGLYVVLIFAKYLVGLDDFFM